MNTITLVNGNATITLNPELSKAAQFKEAVVQGFNAGKTSFINLVNGKVESVKGWVLRIVEEVKAVVFDMIDALMNTGLVFSKIKESKTETYGTVVTNEGRLQINPLQKGLFSVMFFPKKTADMGVVAEATETFNGQTKSQYVKLGKLNLQQLDAAIALF